MTLKELLQTTPWQDCNPIIFTKLADCHLVEWCRHALLFPIPFLRLINLLPPYQFPHHLNAILPILHLQPPLWQNPIQIFAPNPTRPLTIRQMFFDVPVISVRIFHNRIHPFLHQPEQRLHKPNHIPRTRFIPEMSVRKYHIPMVPIRNLQKRVLPIGRCHQEEPLLLVRVLIILCLLITGQRWSKLFRTGRVILPFHFLFLFPIL